MIEWIIQNKTWLFSGVAIVVPLTIISWMLARKRSVRKQIQKGGRNSTLIQAGRDVYTGPKITVKTNKSKAPENGK